MLCIKSKLILSSSSFKVPASRLRCVIKFRVGPKERTKCSFKKYVGKMFQQFFFHQFSIVIYYWYLQEMIAFGDASVVFKSLVGIVPWRIILFVSAYQIERSSKGVERQSAVIFVYKQNAQIIPILHFNVLVFYPFFKKKVCRVEK